MTVYKRNYDEYVKNIRTINEKESKFFEILHLAKKHGVSIIEIESDVRELNFFLSDKNYERHNTGFIINNFLELQFFFNIDGFKFIMNESNRSIIELEETKFYSTILKFNELKNRYNFSEFLDVRELDISPARALAYVFISQHLNAKFYKESLSYFYDNKMSNTNLSIGKLISRLNGGNVNYYRMASNSLNYLKNHKTIFNNDEKLAEFFKKIVK